MAMRSSWDGFLKLSLISVPVRAYSATVPAHGDIHFNQLHKDCGQRIRYQKVCPDHGVVTKDQIVSGYEYEKGQYIELTPAELAKVKGVDDEALNIEAFMAPDEIDPVFLSGKSFYLVPDGPAGQKPYALLHQVMKDKNRHAIATVVLSGHDEVVLIRPLDKLLTMTVLYYQDQLKKPSAFEDEVSEPKVSAQEVKLAGTLVDASTAEDFDFSRYKDLYTERTAKLLESKLAGEKLVTPRKHKGPAIINLMDALRKSLDQKQAGDKPPRRKAASVRPARHGRRKTG